MNVIKAYLLLVLPNFFLYSYYKMFQKIDVLVFVWYDPCLSAANTRLYYFFQCIQKCLWLKQENRFISKRTWTHTEVSTHYDNMSFKEIMQLFLQLIVIFQGNYNISSAVIKWVDQSCNCYVWNILWSICSAWAALCSLSEENFFLRNLDIASVCWRKKLIRNLKS